MTNFRDHSRNNWVPRSGDLPTDTQINVGSLQRIADAVEKMAASYDQMRNSRDFWQSRANENLAAVERLARSNNALRGALTRMKKRVAR